MLQIRRSSGCPPPYRLLLCDGTLRETRKFTVHLLIAGSVRFFSKYLATLLSFDKSWIFLCDPGTGASRVFLFLVVLTVAFSYWCEGRSVSAKSPRIGEGKVWQPLFSAYPTTRFAQDWNICSMNFIDGAGRRHYPHYAAGREVKFSFHKNTLNNSGHHAAVTTTGQRSLQG